MTGANGRIASTVGKVCNISSYRPLSGDLPRRPLPKPLTRQSELSVTYDTSQIKARSDFDLDCSLHLRSALVEP